MAFDITKPAQDTLTPEEKSWFDTQLKTASEAAVAQHKTEAEAARAAAIPEKYEFQFSENSPLDPKADAEATASLAKKLGLSKEQAAELLKHQETLAGGVIARQQQTLQSQIQKWNDEVKADKDLGGANYTATLAAVKRVIDKFGAAVPEFGQLVEASGYGSHPAFVKIFAAIGKAMGEDGSVNGGPPKAGTKSAAEILYGDTK
jgi:hypothetical protein